MRGPSPRRRQAGTINHRRARVELLCAACGWSFRDLARAMGRTYQGLVGALNRRPAMARTAAVLDADLCRAFGCPLHHVQKPVTPAEYGGRMIPRYDERMEAHE